MKDKLPKTPHQLPQSYLVGQQDSGGCSTTVQFPEGGTHSWMAHTTLPAAQ